MATPTTTAGLSDIFTKVETAAKTAGIDVYNALLFLAHFAVQSTPALNAAADVAETVTGNAALIPLTNAISTTVETTAAGVVATKDPITQLNTVVNAVKHPT